ncbi:zinc finger protein Xfin-like isoform X1 [Armigeres subalbatus]|uniref:zinc finger protein Xfin-like isoform X1 n=1 Tax=Armigeres subalbatus TaxID=124917 RepID=UPI002ED507CC
MNPLISTGDDLLDVPSGDPAKFCRLCFSELDVEELFPDGQGIRQDVIERIHKCTGIQITLEDDYPSAVCWMCLMSLEQFQWFRERCLRSDVLIRCKRKQMIAKKVGPVVVTNPEFPMIEDDDGDYDDDDDDEPDGPVLRISSVQENVQPMDEDISKVIPQSYEPPAEEQDVKPNAEALAAFATHFMAGGDGSDNLDATSTSEDAERRFKCNLCSRSFKNKANLWEHNRLHQGTLPFPCEDCGTMFSRLKSLEAHRIKYHSKDSTEDPPLRLQCPFCPRVFPRKGDRTQHVKMGHPDLYVPSMMDSSTPTLSSGRNTPASGFGAASSTMQSMPDKKTIVTIKPPPPSNTPTPRRRGLLAYAGQDGPNLNCTICTKIFPSVRELEEHVSKDHPIGSIMACPFCPKTFKSRQTIRMHILNHQGKLPFKCDDCDARFDRKFYLQKHRERYHQGDDADKTLKCRFRCKFCPRIFLRKIDRKTHTRLVHQAEIKVKKEKLDPEIDSNEVLQAQESNSSTPSSLQQTELSFGCLQCGMQFRSAEKLRSHTALHHQKKDVKPLVATKSQNPRPTRLGVNVRRPFKCQYCPKTFAQKYVMKEHTFIHTGSLRYPCDICMAMFNRPHYLRAHKSKYHSENSTFEAIKCRFCTRTFVRKQDIKIHERVAHNVSDYDDANVQREIFQTSQNGSLEEAADGDGGVEGEEKTTNQSGKTSVVPYTIDEEVDDFDGDDDDDYIGEENVEEETNDDIPENPEIRDVVVTLERIPDAVLETLETSYDDYEGEEETDDEKQDNEPNGDAESGSNRTDTPRLNMSITLHRCPKCQKVFKTLKSLKHHMIYHQSQLPFACDECGVQFARNRPLQIHKERYHSEDAPYQGQRFSCDYCPRIFLRDRDKVFHQKIVHSMERSYHNRDDGTPELKKSKIKKRKDYVCLTCCERFESEKACQRHINLEHPDETIDKMACDSVIPALLVTPKLEPDRHSPGNPEDKVNIPDSEQPPPPPAPSTSRPYKLCRCTICVSTFKNRDNWDDHLANHPNVRPHHCETCLIKRKSRSNRKITSVGFKCQHCPKVFTKANTLRTHSRLHTSELRFPCDECGMMYDRYRLLQAHKDKYHSEDSYMHPPLETFRCMYCPRTFMRQRDCNFHQESVHAV